MLYKAAAYHVALTLTLLFTTTEADFDIEKGKTAVNRLLSNLISIVLENQSNLKGLINVSDELIKDDWFSQYLEEEGLGYTLEFLHKTNDYYHKFRALLLQANPNGTLVRDSLIPMNLILLIKDFSEPSSVPIEVPPYLRKITNEDLNKKDVNGFETRKGIHEMVVLLSGIMKLVLDKKCTDLISLSDIANNIMNPKTKLYAYVMSATTAEFADAIKKEINVYKTSIRDALSNDLRNVILGEIQTKCKKKFDEGSSSKGQ